MSKEASETSATTPAKHTGLRRRSVRILLGVVVTAIVVRAALPEVLRRVAISQADKALIGRIEIDDIDLALVTGGVTLKGLRVYASDLPAAESKPADAPPAPIPTATPPLDTHADPSATPPSSDAAASADAGTPKPVPTGESASAASAKETLPAAEDKRASSPEAAPEGRTATTSPPHDGKQEEKSEAANPTPPSTSKPENLEPEPPATENAGTTPGATPMFSAARLSVDIGWRPLLHKVVELQAIELEQFDARIDRLQNGTLVLPKPVPSDAPSAPEEPTPSNQSPGWGVLIEQLSLRDGNLAFRDFTVDPAAKPLKAEIPSLDASNMALLITDTALQPGTVSLNADVLGGHLSAELTQRTVAAGAAFESHVVLTDLPISDALVYIPRLKWTSLNGRLDIDLKHSFEPEGPHNLSGVVVLRDMVIRVAGLEAPPLAWKKLAVDIGDVDVVKHNARITQVALEGGHVIARAGGPEPFPVLRGLLNGEETAQPAAASAVPPAAMGTQATAPPASQSPTQPQAQPGSSAPWTWQVEQVKLRDTTIDVLGGDKPLVFAVSSEVANLASAPKTRSKFTLNVKPPEGTIALTGEFALDPLGFDGRLKLDSVSLPPLSTPVATEITRLLHQGVLSTDLQIAAGTTPAAPSDGAKIAGAVSLNDFVITGDDDKAFAVRWSRIALDIDSIFAPGVLATGGAQPLSIALSSLTFDRPEFVITRTERGIALPHALGGSDASGTEVDGDNVQAGATPPNAATKPENTAAEPAAQASDSPQAASPIDVRIDRVAIHKMRIGVTDKAVKPLYRSSLDPIDFSATDVRWPGPYAHAVDLTARGLDGAKLSVTGDVAPSGSKLKAELDGMPLAPLHPYAAGAGYGLGGGTASLYSKIKLTGEDYETENKVVINKLQVTGAQGDSLFASQFGMPLSLALGLMTDLQGNITLNLPVSGGRNGTSIGVGTAIRDALKQAILSTATSPLKLIGAVAEIGQKPSSLTPQPIVFALGRNREAEGEAAKIDQLGKFMASTAALALRLHGETSDDDRRWLAEQKLRAKIEEESGFMGSVRHIGEGDDREAALAYLEAREQDKAAEMPAQHKAWFDAALAKQQVTDTELRALAGQRAEAVRDRLVSGAKIDPTRIVLDPIAPEDLAARAAVSITLETAATAQTAPTH